MSTYLALLRGINVGGRNVIRMADLKACFEEGGFTGVTTYIQSGNVVFDAKERGVQSLTSRIEGLLGDSFGYEASVVVLNGAQTRGVIHGAPKGFGSDPEKFRSDVIFLKPSLTPGEAMKQVPTRDGVDRAWAGKGVLYFERLTSRASQSRLSKVMSMPIYKEMTIRNWATTTRLAELMQGRG
jgi:uncharacterized protein (DUF1697 family)